MIVEAPTFGSKLASKLDGMLAERQSVVDSTLEAHSRNKELSERLRIEERLRQGAEILISRGFVAKVEIKSKAPAVTNTDGRHPVVNGNKEYPVELKWERTDKGQLSNSPNVFRVTCVNDGSGLEIWNGDENTSINIDNETKSPVDIEDVLMEAFFSSKAAKSAF